MHYLCAYILQFVKKSFEKYEDNRPICHVYFKEDAQEAYVDFGEDRAVQFGNWEMKPETSPKVHTV